MDENNFNNYGGGNQPDYNQQYNQQNYQPYYQQQDGFQQQYPQYNVPADNSKGMAVASLVLGILSFFCCGSIFSILGIIFGAISLSRKKQGNGLAVAGLIISCIALVLWIILMIFMFATGYYDILSHGGYYYY